MYKSYLQRHRFDGERLRRHALEEFSLALRSGRLIAFVGSWATREFDYPGWGKFLEGYADAAYKRAEGQTVPTSASLARRREMALSAIAATKPTLSAGSADALTGLSVIEYALDHVPENGARPSEALKEDVKGLFRLRGGGTPASSVPHRLRHQMGIDRIITLNYDLEFEWLMMTTPAERGEVEAGADDGRAVAFDALLKAGKIVEDDSTRGLSRILPNGHSALSDIFSRERTDRLIEFAVGSPDYEGHVFHLHGRVTDPKTMVVSQRDYNNQYRRSGVTKLPFEHALRILFSGNPILFVGLGMSEDDVTATLEQMVSDHPTRPVARAFVLWNAPTNEVTNEPEPIRKEALRFKWLHRFGLLTLFDDELADAGVFAKPDLVRLGDSVTALADRATTQMDRYVWVQDDFRNVKAKYLAVRSGDARDYCDIWPTDASNEISNVDVSEAIAQEGLIRLFVGDPGSGKGRLAQALRKGWLERPRAPGEEVIERISCVVNANFAFESDSIFALLSGLADGEFAAEKGLSRGRYLLRYVKSAERHRELLIVINGMERFFSPNGSPLSGELDMLMRRLVELGRKSAEAEKARQNGEADKDGQEVVGVGEAASGDDKPAAPDIPPYTVYLLGTNRVRRYFNALRPPSGFYDDAREFSEEALALPKDGTRSAYLNTVRARFSAKTVAQPLSQTQEALIGWKSTSDRNGVRRSVFAAYLQPEMLHAAQVKHPDLALDIITVMAFIGTPVEDAVLLHSPRVRQRLRKFGDAMGDVLVETLRSLKDLALVFEIQAFPGSPPDWTRYGLHRVVLSEMRDRLGVPLTDSQLSAGFNVSIFAAQPADGYSPERAFHDELGTLVDFLSGAYKDEPLGGWSALGDRDPGQVLHTGGATRGLVEAAMLEDGLPRPDTLKAWPHVAACLRAALSLVRCYYSTSTLLSYTLEARPDEEDGPLTQHADRLSRLIKAAVASAEARREARKRLSEEDAIKWLGPAPFYPDDLVWLHNELGVVKLAQGNLYEARYALDEAVRINAEHVEFADQGPNWRRIMLNQVHVDIERAQLDRAEGRMNRIEEAIAVAIDKPLPKIKAAIIKRYGQESVRNTGAIDRDYPHDVILSLALVMGYRGLTLHLQGQLEAAEATFRTATNILDNIGERRAYGMFQRHYAALMSALRRDEGHMQALRLALAAADATRQVDVAHHARIAMAWYNHAKANPQERATQMRQLQRALGYADAGDMHRVRVEAGINLARIKLNGGDHDAALEHAADAMATAVRYGLSLRKISIRILIGQILIRRGDPISGRALLERALRNADRVNYQRAVELAQNVLVEEPAI